MDSGLLHVLHDAGHVHVRAVRQPVHVHLDGVLQIRIHQHRAVARDPHRVGHVADQRLVVVDDLHGPPAQHIGRPEHQRIADIGGDALGFGQGPGDAVGRLAQADLSKKGLEPLPVLGQVYGVGRGAEDGDVGCLEGRGQLERRLPAELDDDAEKAAPGLLDTDQFGHVLLGQGLEVQPVRGVVIGGHGLRIAIDHNGLEAGFLEGIGRVHAAVIELDPLADAVRAAAQYHHLVAVRRVGLAFGRRQPVALVGGIHIRRARGELGGAGVDALEHRDHAQGPAAAGHRGRRLARELGQALIGKAQHLQAQ